MTAFIMTSQFMGQVVQKYTSSNNNLEHYKPPTTPQNHETYPHKVAPLSPFMTRYCRTNEPVLKAINKRLECGRSTLLRIVCYCASHFHLFTDEHKLLQSES